MTDPVERVIILVLDSLGIGATPDAHQYGDAHSNTLGHVATAVGGLNLPHLSALGLGCLLPVAGVPAVSHPRGAWGRMGPAAVGKDTTTGHWELVGVVLQDPFPLYPKGFPAEVLDPIETAFGTKVLGNKPASGTEIIRELGEAHLATGRPIVYTSADSVFQIAAHEGVIPPEELYQMCLHARKVLQGKHGVGRVIARPFIGEPGNFRRTANRRDFALEPPGWTLLDSLVEKDFPVVGIGKIEDIFAGRGLTKSLTSKSNREGMKRTLEAVTRPGRGLIFVNLVDFDTLYGHRNDPVGYAQGLEEFDQWLPQLDKVLNPSDLVFITADHGCDPTTAGTDHTREYVPILVYGPRCGSSIALGTRETFADVAASIAELLGIPWSGSGKSFAGQLKFLKEDGSDG